MSTPIAKERLAKFNQAKIAISSGRNRMYLYESLAVEEAYKKFNGTTPEPYHAEYEPDISKYQYDLEVFIFLNYEQLKIREVELRSSNKESLLHAEHGATLLPREQHLLNAASIRWPEKETPSGRIITALAPTQWLYDLYYGMSNYNNVNVFGGGGQGKTYGILAFHSIIFDHFIYTKPGAQCTYSTVSQSKLEGSSWGYVNKLYNSAPSYKFSLYANKALVSSDFTYRRPALSGQKGKFNKEGGTFKGVLLQKGLKGDQVTDKLTGCHDPIARCYLLDEAQSTDFAPLNAYTNMFLHPTYKWFNLSGNYAVEGDLLDLNICPVGGWKTVDETTHMWESRLSSPTEQLGQKSLTIHFNNDLSPAMTDPEMERKYSSFLPTRAKRDELYPTPESRKTLAYKRFWIGFKFEKPKENEERILTDTLLDDFFASNPPEVNPLLHMASFDSATTSTDRNPFSVFGIGLDKNGYAIVWPRHIELIEKSPSLIQYYGFTTRQIIKLMKKWNIQNNHLIMDFTQHTALIEKLAAQGVICHGLIYHQKCPSKREPNEITKILEEPIIIPMAPTLSQSGTEKSNKLYAHERIANRITLGAYIFRLFIEYGRVRGINSDVLEGAHGFEKEIMMRSFISKKIGQKEFITIDFKKEFRKKYKFSPDILDTIYQFFYMLFVIFKVDPTKKGLGLLTLQKEKREVDNQPSIWDSMRNRF